MPETAAVHTDDVAVDRFAAMMKEKLAIARAKGRGGWETCYEEELLEMLDHHVLKGDMRDVANIAMMIHLNREDRRAAWAEEVPLV